MRVPEPGAATAVLGGRGIVASAYDPMTDLLYVDAPPDDGARITEVLAARRHLPRASCAPKQVDLETVFLELTEGTRPGRPRRRAAVPGGTPDPGAGG